MRTDPEARRAKQERTKLVEMLLCRATLDAPPTPRKPGAVVARFLEAVDCRATMATLTAEDFNHRQD